MKRAIQIGMVVIGFFGGPVLAISSNYALLQAAREKVELGDHEMAALLYRRAIQLDEQDTVARAELSALIVDDFSRNWHAEEQETVYAALSHNHSIVEGIPDLSLNQLQNIVLEASERPWQKEALTTLHKIHLKDSSALALAVVLKNKHPDHVVTYNLLGLAYQMQGQFQTAEKSFQKALELNPNFVVARLNLADLYLQTRRNQEAQAELNHVLAFKPHHRQACLMMGQLALSESNPELAQMWYTKASEDL